MNNFNITSNTLNLKKDKILVIPTSPMEQYGTFLPITTGIKISTKLATDISKYLSTEENNIIVAPPFFQLSTKRSENINISFHNDSTYENHPLFHLLNSYINMGFNKIMLLSFNLELENTTIIRKITNKLSNDKIKIYEPGSAIMINGIKEIDEFLKDNDVFPEYEVHGDIKETSIMLYLEEKSVDETYKNLPPVRINIKTKKLAGTKTFLDMGATEGYIGTPSAATIKIGKKLYKIYRKKYEESLLSIIEGKEPIDLPMLLKLTMI
jgi:creatinine amidohydrolase